LSVFVPAKHPNRLFFKGLGAKESGFARALRQSPQNQKGLVKPNGNAGWPERSSVAAAPIIHYCVGMHFLSRCACCAANPRERREIAAG
jgi:hypothetical protein